MNDFLAICNILAIVVVAVIGARSQMQMARHLHSEWRWIKQSLSIVCGIWAVVYLVILFNFFRGMDTTNLIATRSWVIRPMILITLSLIAASGIARRKTNGY